MGECGGYEWVDARMRFMVRNLNSFASVDVKIEVGGVCQIWTIRVDFALTDTCVLSGSVPGTPG